MARVLSSAQFQKTTRLRAFLDYVCARYFEDPQVRISEEELAEHVFDRMLDGQSDDTIVRVSASQLRKRLEHYFAGPGAGEELVIEIAKGSYTPLFRHRDPAGGVAEVPHPGSEARAPLVPVTGGEFAPMEPPVVAPVSETRSRIFFAMPAVVVVCVVLAFAAGWYAKTSNVLPKAAPDDPVIQFWSRLLPNNLSTDVILSDGGLSLFSDTVHRSLTLTEYLSRNYESLVPDAKLNPDRARLAVMMMRRQNTPFGDANLARKLMRVAHSVDGGVSFAYARDYSVRQFKSHNVVILGALRANPWVDLINPKVNFQIGYDESRQVAVIANKAPEPGELPVYTVDPANSRGRTGYAVLAYLPNLVNEANVIFIGGSEMEGTEACGDWLTSSAGVSQLLRWLNLPASSSSLPYFEVLLRTRVIGGAAPQIDIVAHRTGAPADRR